MARQVSDEQATAALPGSIVVPDARHGPEPLLAPAGAAAVAGAVAVGAGLGAIAAFALQGSASVEPALANLLHAMVGIKAIILTAALALVLFRLRGPAGMASLLGYCGGLGLSTAGLVWLWGLSGLPIGAAFFYGGLVATYVTAARDPLLADGLRRAVSPRR